MIIHKYCPFNSSGPSATYAYCEKNSFPSPNDVYINGLTHWGRVTHICVGKLTINDSDNGLSPGWRQAIIWTNAGILLIGPSGTNFNEILIGIQTFSFKKIHLKMSSAKWHPFCLGLNVLMQERHKSRALAMELHLSCTNPLIWFTNLSFSLTAQA